MNIMHLKYAVEVAKAGTISKASEILLIGQPNLSRAIKELENSIGISIFTRTARGMTVTPEGKQFLSQASNILQQIEYVESLYNNKAPKKQRFSISVPRVSYISDAFVSFSGKIDSDPSELFYMETNSLRTIDNVLHNNFRLGIIRYSDQNDHYFKQLLEEKDLACRHIADFPCVLLMSADNPLASRDQIHFHDLEPYVEIIHSDQIAPAIPSDREKNCGLSDNVDRRIYVFERASRFDLLAENSRTFIWGTPIPDKFMKRYGLVQKSCADSQLMYRDLLIYRKDYQFTELDQSFFDELQDKKQHIISGISDMPFL